MSKSEMVGKEIKAAPCIVCGAGLVNLDERGGNQPLHGCEFTTNGHYGCAQFDPMDGTRLALNLCDPCHLKAKADGRLLVMHVYSTRQTKVTYEVHT